MKVGFVQMQPSFGDKDSNLKKVEQFVSASNADLLVLPELFNTGYLFQSKEEMTSLAEKIPGKTTDFLEKLCKQKNLCIIAGIAEHEYDDFSNSDKFYNTAVMVTPDGIAGTYRKLHLFKDEKKWFNPGAMPLMVYPFHGIKVGMMICFDWWFPEVARIMALQGVHLICHPANLVLPYCQEAMVVRSLENRIFTITCNRIGQEKRGNEQLSFTGSSQITSPDGKRLLQASANEEGCKIVEIDPKEAENKNITPMNNLFQDRRVEFYDLLLKT